MPLYEYQCKKCGHRFERIQMFSDKPLKKCPECGGALEKLISASAVQFKGSGWYVTDYPKKGAGSVTSSAASSPEGDSGKKESGESKEAKVTKKDEKTKSDSSDKKHKKD
jgi:putative FmdB family regulatory protein